MQGVTRVGFFGVREWEKRFIEKEIISLPTYGVGVFREELGEMVARAAEYQIISVAGETKVDKELLEKLPRLQLLLVRAREASMVDKVAAEEKGVWVKTVPAVGSQAVAEYTWALLLAVAKRVAVAKEAVEEGDMTLASLTGIELYKKTLAVIGVGRIGQKVVHIAKGFGMNVLGVERIPDEVSAKKHGYKVATLEEALRAADLVTVHVPANEATYHLLNKKMIGMMRQGAILVNTSRGPVVETEALVWGLDKGILAGVGCDGVEEEEDPDRVGLWPETVSFRRLIDRDDVIFTPHNAMNVQEVWEQNVKAAIGIIDEYLKLKK